MATDRFGIQWMNNVSTENCPLDKLKRGNP